MKKLLAVAIIVGFIPVANAATAIWTGRQERVQTITHQWVLKCYYQYQGQIYTSLFDGFQCPTSIELR